ncbi:MAG: aminodeoxychorismate synthase component I [Chitinispirillaceae bacterium]
MSTESRLPPQKSTTGFYELNVESLLPPGEGSPSIFLDTAGPDSRNLHSYLFTNPLHVLSTKSWSDITTMLERLDDYSRRYWIAGYITYEACFAFEDRLAGFRTPEWDKNLLWFGVYDKPLVVDHLSGHCIPGWNIVGKKDLTSSQPELKLDFGVSLNDYIQKVASIKDYIARGDTYQVNYTFDVDIESHFRSDLDLYRHLRKAQNASFCSFIHTPDLIAASFSPELFFRVKGERISVKPMKGTSSRGRFEAEDIKRVEELKKSEKERAENLMIVDLMRNDLGRICRNGTVSTSELFQVETHRTVHQMTSTVEGVLKPDIGLSGIFKALFPCGSVTGAPKIRTMQIIQELERGERGLYCGALGYSSPDGHAAFSVPIRTLQKTARQKSWNYRVGSGITWDSEADKEYEECLVKCSFLTARKREFEIFESILFLSGRPVFLKEHLDRFYSSARYFSFPFDPDEVWEILNDLGEKTAGYKSCKARIFLSERGVLHCDFESLGEKEEGSGKLCVISDHRMDSSNAYLFHKTTYRPWYDEAKQVIREGKAWDVVFLNNEGFLTEGARSNLFLKKDGILYTPPLECGLLPGVCRRKLLERGVCREKRMTRRDLLESEGVYMGNSVRGLVRVGLGEIGS